MNTGQDYCFQALLSGFLVGSRVADQVDLASDPAELFLRSCDWGMYTSTTVLLSVPDCSGLTMF